MASQRRLGGEPLIRTLFSEQGQGPEPGHRLAMTLVSATAGGVLLCAALWGQGSRQTGRTGPWFTVHRNMLSKRNLPRRGQEPRVSILAPQGQASQLPAAARVPRTPAYPAAQSSSFRHREPLMSKVDPLRGRRVSGRPQTEIGGPPKLVAAVRAKRLRDCMPGTRATGPEAPRGPCLSVL